jgi:hypothetical protein
VVGEETACTGYLHIVDAVVTQHLLGHLLAGKPAANRGFRIFLNTRGQGFLHNPARNHQYDKNDKVSHLFRCFLRLQK